jgi:hypothetical protein
MKNLIFVIFLGLILMSCKYKTQYSDTKIPCVVDSVEYHGIGCDNTLQTTPYWKLYLKNPEIKITSYRSYEKGDTVYVIERKIKK